jgi:UDP-N-acetylglucosamine 2-epimerase (non-hydrolysing)
LADYNFAPTEWAKSNLLREGILQENIWVTGNTVIDALLFIKGKQEGESARIHWLSYFKRKYNLSLHNNTQKILLVTGHRRENFGKALENICHALNEIAYKRKDITIVYPVHLNPNVQQPVRSMIDEQPNIRLTEPLDYEPFIFLMTHSYLILTDSGGIQEEAPSLGKPVLVMRNTTERPEGIVAETTKLIGTDRESIVKHTTELIDNQPLYERMARAANPFGDGHASERIVKIIAQALIK